MQTLYDMKYFSIVIALLLPILAFANSSELLDRVLSADSTEDILGTKTPNMNQRRDLWNTPSKLASVLAKNKNNEKAWAAFHHFRTLTDGGLTTFYRDACFYLLSQDREIYFTRYMNGDDKALDRMVDALWHQLVEDGAEGPTPNHDAEKLFILINKNLENKTKGSRAESFSAVFNDELSKRHQYIKSHWPEMKMSYNKSLNSTPQNGAN